MNLKGWRKKNRRKQIGISDLISHAYRYGYINKYYIIYCCLFYVHRATATHRGQVIFKDALAQQLCEQGGKSHHHIKNIRQMWFCIVLVSVLLIMKLISQKTVSGSYILKTDSLASYFPLVIWETSLSSLLNTGEYTKVKVNPIAL